MDGFVSSRQLSPPSLRFNFQRPLLDELSFLKCITLPPESSDTSPSVTSTPFLSPLHFAARLGTIKSEPHLVMVLSRSSASQSSLTATACSSDERNLPLIFFIISGISFASGLRLFSGLIQPVTIRHLRITIVTPIYVTSSTSCAETRQGSDHLLDLVLYAESSIVKCSSKVTTPPKICLRFNIVLIDCRNVSTTIVQECGLARFFRNYVIAASPSPLMMSSQASMDYAVSSIDGSSQSCFNDSPTLSHVNHSTLKALPSTTLRVVLFRQSFRVSLQCHLQLASPDSVNCYLLEAVPSTTLCVVLFRQPLRISLQHQEIQTSLETTFNYFQNPLIGFFNVDIDFFVFYRTRALELQVKIFCGFLLSLATSIFRGVLIMLAYHLTVEYLSGCNRPSGS
ncbi:unnamed protein product [Eruca vesicaria subsp. sativa]|uniref:Uncharacterized protein n=1 Tax=Eruca vesicaria subsp. sativa TaxID=29727 RepID=A0ABC8JI26_ERUVS|nr:unnamed protein product [Eruca vesicaria subsp. sativa]